MQKIWSQIINQVILQLACNDEYFMLLKVALKSLQYFTQIVPFVCSFSTACSLAVILHAYMYHKPFCDEHCSLPTGKGRHLRLLPIACLDGDANVIKVEEPRGCTMFTTGIIRQGSTTCMCVAMRRQVFVYEFNRNKGRHKKIKELTLPAPAQCMEVFGGRLCAGYTSGFGLFSIQMQGQHVEREHHGGVA